MKYALTLFMDKPFYMVTTWFICITNELLMLFRILEDDLSELYVYLGSHNLEIFEENRIVHKVKRVTIHKEFTWVII
jgi:hypothetical protein